MRIIATSPAVQISTDAHCYSRSPDIEGIGEVYVIIDNWWGFIKFDFYTGSIISL